MGKLDGKVALITGGTTGIGYASAALFAREGARVIVTGANPANVEKAQADLGDSVEAIGSNAADLSAIKTLMAHVRERYGRIDVLFANAGTGAMRPVGDVDEAFFDSIMGLNMRGVFFTVQQALPLMPDGAAIVLTSSVAGRIGAPGGSVYCASKAAVRSFGRSLGAELAPRRIRVNTLSPGPIDTPIMAKSGIPADMLAEMMRKMVPLGRIGHVDEAARVALFLACDDSSYITAAEIVVSGGQSDI